MGVYLVSFKVKTATVFLRLWNWTVDGILVKHLRGQMSGEDIAGLSAMWYGMRTI